MLLMQFIAVFVLADLLTVTRLHRPKLLLVLQDDSWFTMSFS